MIGNIKLSKTESHTIIAQLTQCHIYITADALGHDTTHIIGQLFHIHPHVIHRMALKVSLYDTLELTIITADKVLQLAPMPNTTITSNGQQG